MSTRHIKELAANAKSGRQSSGWLADMAILELGAIQEPLEVVLSERGASVDSSTYRKALDLLQQVARGA